MFQGKSYYLIVHNANWMPLRCFRTRMLLSFLWCRVYVQLASSSSMCTLTDRKLYPITIYSWRWEKVAQKFTIQSQRYWNLWWRQRFAIAVKQIVFFNSFTVLSPTTTHVCGGGWFLSLQIRITSSIANEIISTTMDDPWYVDSSNTAMRKQ